jgi:hypothetical protein
LLTHAHVSVAGSALELAADANAPDCRALFEIIPGEPISASSFKLAAERPGIMIHDKDEPLAGLESFKRVKHKGVTLVRDYLTNVQ